MTMRNSFIAEEEFQKALIRILTLDTGCLPVFMVPREDRSVVLIAPVHHVFSFLLQTDSLIRTVSPPHILWNDRQAGHSSPSLTSLHSHLQRWPRKTRAGEASPSHAVIPAHSTHCSIFSCSDNPTHAPPLPCADLRGELEPIDPFFVDLLFFSHLKLKHRTMASCFHEINPPKTRTVSTPRTSL